MSTEESPLLPLPDLLRVFEIEDTAEQIRRAQSEVVPVLAGELRAVTEIAKTIYGDAWLDLITFATRPAPRNPDKTSYRPDFADAGWCAKRRQDRPYRVFGRGGQRAMILDVRTVININEEALGARLVLRRSDEVRFFEEVWHAAHEECLALMEACGPDIWADVDLPGPPHTTLSAHVDRLIGSRPEWLVIASQGAGRGLSTRAALDMAGWGLVCLLPILIGVIECSLGRHPSVRAMHERLCKHLTETQRNGDEYEPAHISSAQRYKVFERDGFRCTMCGATAATGAKLEVDHIVPRARGGSNAMSNLQTLCDRCNRGKSANLSPDLRRRR